VVWVVAVVGCKHAATEEIEAGASPAAAVSLTPLVATHVIKLARTYKTGMKAHFVDDADDVTHTTTVFAGTTKTESKVVHVHLDAQDTIVELAPNERPLREELVVQQFWQVTSDGSKAVIAPPGAHVAIKLAPKKTDAEVTVAGRPATKEVREALGEVMSLTTHTGPSDDEVMGTKTPEPVGGQWSMNAELAKAELAREGIVAKPGSFEGSMKLMAARTVGGVEVLDVVGHMALGLASLEGLPSGSTVSDANMDIVVKSSEPADGSVEPTSEMTIHLQAAMTVPTPKGDVSVKIDTLKTKHSTASVL